MPRKLKNIRPWKGGWQAYTQIHGKTRSKSFHRDTPTETMRAWVKAQRDRHATVKDTAGSFGAEIQDYLPRVTALVSYKQRAAHLELWAKALGRDRPRQSIKTTEIDQVIQRWLLSGLSDRTVRKRRMSLLSMWNMLDGKEGPNPVRASQCPREPKDEARGLDYPTIARLLDSLAPSPTKTRMRVMAWTGLPPGMIGKIQPGDIDFRTKTLRVRPRRKGAGVEARTLPLLPQAVDALTQFDRERIYGPFPHNTLNALFHRACLKQDPPLVGYRVYDLRHSFGTMLYTVTKDLATVSRFLMHASVSMSQRYAMGAMRDVDRAAADLAGRHLSLTPVPPNKPRKQKHLHV